MGLFGRKAKVREAQAADFVPVDGEQLFVGEASYQPQLIALLTARGYKASELANVSRPVSESFTARLIPELNNRYDSNAVGVHVMDKLVAYLSRANAARYRAAFGTSVGEVPVVLWVKAGGSGIVSVWPED